MAADLTADKPTGSNNRLDELMGSGAAVLARALQRHGVAATFGQSIPSAFHLLAPRFGIRQLAYRTESSGAIMADGYARIAGRIGVVTAMHGPAAALLVPGLAEALKASIPVLALVQEVDRRIADRNAASEIDQIPLLAGAAKWIRRIDHVKRIDDYVDMAVTQATSGRPGPAVLLLPIDLMEGAAESARHRRLPLGAYPLDRPVADPAAVAQAAQLIAAARLPIVIAGGGVVLSGAQASLTRLQELACLAVGTTTMGKGCVDERHPLSLGPVGYYMGPGGAARHHGELIGQADVIVFVGSRTNQNGTDSWRVFPRTARFIHIDMDGTEIGRNYEAVRLVGDARTTLDALATALEHVGLSARKAARSALEVRIATGRARHETEARALRRSDAMPLRPERLMDELDALLPDNAIVVADASYASVWAANYLTARRAGARFLFPRGLAGLGWGLPLALGAQAAQPDAPVIAIVGDGGFAHSWSELETARRLELPVGVLVLNNQTLAYERHYETIGYGAYTDACDFAPVDHAQIARACGCRGVRLERPQDIAAALSSALDRTTPMVIDAMVSAEAYPPITGFAGKL